MYFLCDNVTICVISEDGLEDDLSLKIVFFLAFWHALKAEDVLLGNREINRPLVFGFMVICLGVGPCLMFAVSISARRFKFL